MRLLLQCMFNFERGWVGWIAKNTQQLKQNELDADWVGGIHFHLTVSSLGYAGSKAKQATLVFSGIES